MNAPAAGRVRLGLRGRLTLTYAVLIPAGTILLSLVITAILAVTGAGVAQSVDLSPAPDTRDFQPVTGTVVEVGSLVRTFLIALIVVTILAVAAGWLLAGRIVRPLAEMNDVAQAAARGNLDHRVGTDGPRDEIHDLAETFNEMLDALDRSLAAHRRFAANASHELRTPLAATQTMIDVTLHDPGTNQADLRELSERIRQLNTRNIQTVDALLDLADIGGAPHVREPCDLDAIARDVVSHHLPDAHDHGISLRMRSPAIDVPAVAAPVLLRQAISNLVLNGIHHNHPGGTVTVATEQHGAVVAIRIENTGDLVPPDELDSLREPFRRLEGRVEGSQRRGLGLAIVQEIADATDSNLTLVGRDGGGLIATLELPGVHRA